jgi:transposase
MANLEEQRVWIVVLSEEGYGIREISRELNISRNSVRTWILIQHAGEGILEDRRRHNHGVRRLTNEQRVDMQHHY